MNFRKLRISVVVICAMLTPVLAQSNSGSPKSPVVVGTLMSADSSGTRFEVQQSGDLRKLYVNSESKVYFVGFPTKREQKLRAGLGVKASCTRDGRVKMICFTPPIGKPAMLGEKRLTMTEFELFKEVDKDTSNSISYVEFNKYVYYSPKHGPDSFRKSDKDSDGALDSAEFVQALSKVSWWRLSRKTPGDWFIQADKDKDGMLEMKEFARICTSGNHLEKIFKRTDRDASGSLSERETAAYVRSVTHGKQRSKRTRKRAGEVTTQPID